MEKAILEKRGTGGASKMRCGRRDKNSEKEDLVLTE